MSVKNLGAFGLSKNILRLSIMNRLTRDPFLIRTWSMCLDVWLPAVAADQKNVFLSQFAQRSVQARSVLLAATHLRV
jgi:hypothetical protein